MVSEMSEILANKCEVRHIRLYYNKEVEVHSFLSSHPRNFVVTL